MQPDKAETIGLKALGWLVGNDDVLPVFLGATGMAANDLAAGAADPEVLAAVLDFLLMDDAWVVAFCDAAQLPYTAPAAARAGLPGGGAVHWT